MTSFNSPMNLASPIKRYDIAKMHIKAMTVNDANNKRFLLSTKNLWYYEVASLLNENGYKTAKIKAPDFLIKLFALFNPAIKPFVKSLGVEQKYSTEQAKKVLNWRPSNIEKSILSAAKQIQKLKINNN